MGEAKIQRTWLKGIMQVMYPASLESTSSFFQVFCNSPCTIPACNTQVGHAAKLCSSESSKKMGKNVKEKLILRFLMEVCGKKQELQMHT